MKKRILSSVLTIAMFLTLAACNGGSSDKPVINDDPELSSNSTEAEESNESANHSEMEASDSESDSGNVSNKVYYVGEDIPAGGYVIECTSTGYAMEVIVFSGREEYKDFQNAEKFTIGEFCEAVELHAWSSFYLEQDEKAYVGLRKGYIILLDDGQCEFNKYNLSASDTVFSGVYVVGEDIDAEKINIKCISDYLQVTLFESKDKYLKYHKTSRFTIGEEADAIEEYAASTDFIYADDSTYAILQDGMIMMVANGIGEYSVDEGPTIN